MERTWYIRLAVVVLAALGAVAVLWPSLYHPLALAEHQVAEGETIEQLAVRYGTTAEEVARLNDLQPTSELRVGQRVDVPGWWPGPRWILDHIDRRITPGLDIQGGLRMMYTVDMDAAVEDRRNARAQQILRRLGEKMDIIEEDEAPDETSWRRSARASPRRRATRTRGSSG
ncbi:MAG: LysM peptidoglycan-binding domain-containing protein [Sandaracinaceae bacterium]|nr:LysM peptidoglycan-binding domain-containing protein [Sandaracinaceae bacterium]